MPVDQTPWTHRALRFQRARPADLWPPFIHDGAALAASAPEMMSGWTKHGVSFFRILESRAVEQRTVALAIVSTIGWSMRKNSLRLAGRRQFSVGVTRIGHHFQLGVSVSYHGLRSFGHGQEAARIVGLIGHLWHHNQPMLRIDCSLHVVSRNLSLRGVHKTYFWFAMLPQLLQGAGDCAGVNDWFLFGSGGLQALQITL